MNKPITPKEMEDWVGKTWDQAQKEAWRGPMTRDDITRMAEKAGMEMNTSGIGWTTADDPNFLYPECVYTENLERFAKLVAAAEREACAKLCDEVDDGRKDLSAKCAVAIRARGKKRFTRMAEK